MKNAGYLRKIQKRLPERIFIQDNTGFIITEDEVIGVLSWIKYFNHHYSIHGIETRPAQQVIIISKRLQIDFGLYNIPDDDGRLVIYLADHRYLRNGRRVEQTLDAIINSLHL